MKNYHSSFLDWISISTKSSLNSIKDYPFVNLKSMSDGPLNNGTGTPYLYMSDMDLTGQDVKLDPKCSIMATLAQSDYCRTENFDPQDPRCARLILTGRLVKVENSSKEFNFAKNALFERHPAMKSWPKNHNFYVAKLNIEQVAVLDFFGGIKYVDVNDYYNAGANGDTLFNLKFDLVEVVQMET